jgi:hypothetical protein
MVDKFGWKAYQNSENPHLFGRRPTTIGKVAAALQQRTGVRAIRIVGDPAISVIQVARAAVCYR